MRFNSRAVLSLSTGLARISKILNNWVETLVSIMGITMAAVVAAQVFFRYGLNHSLFWSEELARLLLTWLTFFGASVAYFYGAHPGVDGLYRRMPAICRRWFRVIVHLASLGLFYVMIYYGVSFAWFVKLQITPALGLPKWLPMVCVPLSGAVLFLHCLGFLVRDLGGTDKTEMKKSGGDQ